MGALYLLHSSKVYLLLEKQFGVFFQITVQVILSFFNSTQNQMTLIFWSSKLSMTAKLEDIILEHLF